MPLDGPFGALLSVTIQALVYVALVRLLVVDTGALDWRAMGVGPLDGTAVVEMGRGALWAVPVIAVTAVVVGGPAPGLPGPAGQPAATDRRDRRLRAVAAGRGHRGAVRRGDPVPGVRDDGLGPRPRRTGEGWCWRRWCSRFAHVLTIGGTNAGEAFGLAVVGFGSRIPVALALGWIFLRRGTVWASFGLHAAFNGILLVLAEAAEPVAPERGESRCNRGLSRR